MPRAGEDAERDAGIGQHQRAERDGAHRLLALVLSIVWIHRSYPRLYYLNDAVTPTVFDSDESKFNSLELRLQGRNSLVFGQQFHWVVSSDTPFDDTFDESVTFWVINETQLSGSGAVGVSRVELLASSISSLGSASITGLYIIVLVTVGAYFRSFLVPDVTTIMYVTLPDPLPILELICGLYITRIDTYKWERRMRMTRRGHLRDESKISGLIMNVFRSNELLMRLTRANALFGVLQMKDELETSNSAYGGDSENASSLLPLITYVIKNMQM